VTVIATPGSTPAALAAKKATTRFRSSLVAAATRSSWASSPASAGRVATSRA
jgi:hypothetical protein